MTSNVFYKFNSQREPSRVTFDGTSISVWELKRDIITQSHLGDGTDFDLFIYNPDTNEEYNDDTTQIPRSSSVTAKRRPPIRPGQGRAARYLTGKMPTTAKAPHRVDQSTASTTASGNSNSGSGDIDPGMTEEEKIAAMFKAGEVQWEQQKAQMAGATPVFRSGPSKRPNTNVPDNPPPPGYVCHRCRQKGHWIQACPTNNDPNYDNGPRVKRTTGIPRSFLRTVQEDNDAEVASDTEEKKGPSNIMINADGQRVEAVPDMASWEQYKAKAEASAAKKDDTAADSKELEELGLACPIDKRLFVEPMKTPCCGRTYCNDCIENALVNSDLVCPGCNSEGVLFDDLVPDEEASQKIKKFHEDKAAKAKAADREKVKQSPPPSSAETESQTSIAPSSVGASKKRTAEDELPNDRAKTKSPPGSKPHSPQQKPQSPVVRPKSAHSRPGTATVQSGTKNDQDCVAQLNELARQHGFNNQMNGMQMPNGMPNFPMPNMMNMPNPMMMNGMNPFAMGMMGFPGMMPPQHGNMNFPYNGMSMANGFNNNMSNGAQAAPTGPKGFRTQFNQHQTTRGAEDDAYMRKPLNPNRAAHRNKRVRPTDYKELGA